MSGRFVGVGITANAAREALPLAAAHARRLGEVLRAGSDFDADGIFCDDFDFDAVADVIRSRRPSSVEKLVVYWAGHGEGGGNLGDLRLLLSGTPTTRPAAGRPPICSGPVPNREPVNSWSSWTPATPARSCRTWPRSPRT